MAVERLLPRPGSRVHDALHRIQLQAERTQAPWLVYNPLKMMQYHALAARDAGPVITALTDEFPEAVRIADVGAGSGAMSAEATRRGRTVVAFERSGVGRLMARAQGVDVRGFSLDRDPPGVVPWEADVALCLEVAEHIPPELSTTLVRFLAGIAPTIVFTSAPPGQGGTGHINEQPPRYWDHLFAEHGARHAPGRTESLRTRFVRGGVSSPWYIDNLRVYARSE